MAETTAAATAARRHGGEDGAIDRPGAVGAAGMGVHIDDHGQAEECVLLFHRPFRPSWLPCAVATEAGRRRRPVVNSV